MMKDYDSLLPHASKRQAEYINAILANGSIRAAARALGIHESAIRGGIESARKKAAVGPTPPVEVPQFPDSDISVEQMIEHQTKRFEKRSLHHKAKQWPKIKVPINGPIGITWFGDPHVDDNGCNWPLLRHDIGNVVKTYGMYGANIGDTTNNWAGRLERLYADQDTSRATAQKLAQWFLQDSKIEWLVWLFGNHDQWAHGTEFYKQVNKRAVYMEDWQARFILQFPNGREVKIHAAHDLPGHSMWNTLHSLQKAAHMKSQADLYVCGHTHNWAIHQEESASREFVYWLVRARGYKFIDEYADQLGHFSQQEGAAVVSIIDPDSKTEAGLIQCFANTDNAAEYLNWKRRDL